MFVVAWAFLIPAVLAGVELIPFPLLGAVFLGQLGSAVLVTWAGGGWREVRHLFGRIFRWRVHPAWYLLAIFGIPIASLLGTGAIFGTGALHALFTNPAVIGEYLSALTILPIVSLWEEAAWMGVVQARLATYRGPVLGAVITGPLFGLLHMPLQIGKPIGGFVFSLTALMLLGIPFRLVLGWLYNATGGSILIVAIAHTTFDASNNGQLLAGAAPEQLVLQPGGGAVFVVVIAGAILALILTRGRLGSPTSEPSLPVLPAATTP
jgi:membrane protease YdiL (CAAX protease family)